MKKIKYGFHYFIEWAEAILVTVLLMSSFVCFGNIKMPSIFSDNMVIQQGMAVPVWGKAEPGEKITVSFKGQVKETIADVNSNWMIKLSGLTADFNPSQMIISGNNTITFDNVLVGEVWICSGQSNMGFKLNECDDGAEAIAEAKNYNIRLFRVANSRDADINDVAWTLSDSSASSAFSGVGFFFGRELFNTLNVPVGLIQSALGGTSVTEWTNSCKDCTGDLYLNRVIPLQPYAIRGVIWYQGERDSRNLINSTNYRERFTALIKSWRKDWEQGDFPFLFVQLPRLETNSVPFWMITREAQMLTLSEPNTAMVCTIDLIIHPRDELHPRNKLAVGQRLAIAARKTAYVENIVYQGPIFNYQSSYIDGDKVIIGFTHIGTGLIVDDSDNSSPKGFEIAGDNGVYVDADAQILGDTVVVVSSLLVQEPKAVRYGWDAYPSCNLFNAQGLPASPFRTINLQTK